MALFHFPFLQRCRNAGGCREPAQGLLMPTPKLPEGFRSGMLFPRIISSAGQAMETKSSWCSLQCMPNPELLPMQSRSEFASKSRFEGQQIHRTIEMGKLIQESLASPKNPWEIWEHLCVGDDLPARSQSQSQNLTF